MSALGPPLLGVIVNPVAGIGGAVALKGSDGADTVRLARERGAVPHAGERATAALRTLAARMPVSRMAAAPRVLVGPGPMGEDSARAAGMDAVPVGVLGDPGATTAADTHRVAGDLLAAGVDLLLVAGGDGTARDVAAAVGTGTPVLGIPAGVKMHSAVYATSPVAAGELAAEFLAAPVDRRRTVLREVVDLDEDAYRAGVIAPRLFGELSVPVADRRLQARKEPSPPSEAADAAAIAAEVVGGLVAGRRYLLGPGSTVRAIADRLGVANTLVGVDVVDIGAVDRSSQAVTPNATPVAADVGEQDVLALVVGRDVTAILTPIGGQGFLIGRGNQQLGPRVLRALLDRLGRDGLLVVATPSKLVGLAGRPLLVDTGDPVLDADLAGYLRVVTGGDEAAIYPVAPG